MWATRGAVRSMQKSPSISTSTWCATTDGTHKTPVIKSWLERHPPFHVHYTPTYSSSINQVERWFAYLTRERPGRRGPLRLSPEVLAFLEPPACAIYDLCSTFAPS